MGNFPRGMKETDPWGQACDPPVSQHLGPPGRTPHPPPSGGAAGVNSKVSLRGLGSLSSSSSLPGEGLVALAVLLMKGEH